MASTTGNRIYQHGNKGIIGPWGDRVQLGVRTVGPCLDGLLLWLHGFSLYLTLSKGELDPCLAAVGVRKKETGRERLTRQRDGSERSFWQLGSG